MRACRLLLLLFAVVLNAAVADDSLDESNAIAKIELLGGKVTRDENLPGRPVIGVDFHLTSKFNNKYVHLLNEFPKLTILNLARCRQITDEGVAEIATLKSLTMLNFTSTQITDAGLKELAQIPNLMELSLSGTRITNTGLNELRHHKNLVFLDIRGAKNVTATEFAAMRESLPKLKNFDECMACMQLEQLGAFANREETFPNPPISEVYLNYNAGFNDEQLPLLKAFPGLTKLELSWTGISNVGDKAVKHPENVTTLYVGAQKSRMQA